MAKRKSPSEDQLNDDSENFNDADDTFGLPEIEYEPLNREEPVDKPVEEVVEVREEYRETVVEEEEPETVEHPEERFVEEEQPSDYTYTFKDEEPPVWPKALLIVLLVVAVVGGGLWYFLKYKPEQDEKSRLAAFALSQKQQQEKRAAFTRDSLAQIEAVRSQRVSDSLAQLNAKPAVGSVEKLTGRTRQYYVVVASAIDDDLLMDHANKLVGQGVTCKIIPPFGKTAFYRLAIDQGDTYADAQTKADGMKGEYGDNVWVVRY